MFPVDFALETIERYSEAGDLVVDPFCGRGTTLYAASALGRFAFGAEINSVGWTYASTKLSPADLDAVVKRLKAAYRKSRDADLPDLPKFFTKAYAPNIRRFLSTARSMLDWRNSVIDRTAMSMLVLYAHGNRENALSNQMRQTKAMSPEYAIRWWDEYGFKPPVLDPIDFLESRLEWRYKYGKPAFLESQAVLGDSAKVFANGALGGRKWSLLLTSPPYMKMANYHYDQWIRLWLLGGAPHPVVNGGEHQSWFANADKYRTLLATVFGHLAKSAAKGAIVYVRTDARKDTKDITLAVLKTAFPKKKAVVIARPLKGKSQTTLYNDVDGPGEVDIRLT